MGARLGRFLGRAKALASSIGAFSSSRRFFFSFSLSFSLAFKAYLISLSFVIVRERAP